jgi:hypothetical protein
MAEHVSAYRMISSAFECLGGQSATPGGGPPQGIGTRDLHRQLFSSVAWCRINVEGAAVEVPGVGDS